MSGVTTYPHGGLKDVSAISNSNRTITGSRLYDAYGATLSTTGSWQAPFGYGGQYGYQEDGNGLQLLGHRYYDPSTGRFLTRDPIKDGRNWYGYCDNNPVNAIDANGLYRILIVGREVSGAFGVWWHWDVVIEEDNGDYIVYGGGPAGGLCVGGPAGLDRTGYSGHGGYKGAPGEVVQEVVRKPGVSGASLNKKAQNFSNAWNRARIPYKKSSDALTSNTYASLLLELLIGRKFPLPKYGSVISSSPGWNSPQVILSPKPGHPPKYTPPKSSAPPGGWVPYI